MKLAALFEQRQSVRRYQDRPVEEALLHQLVEAVRLAPSASNSQPWRLVLVTEPELREKVARATFSRLVSFNRFVLQAPVLVVMTLERPKLITQIGGRLKDRDFPLIDIGIAAEHLCLQAAELGLGSCMLGWFDEPRVKQLLRIPVRTRVGLMVALGYPPEGYPLRKKVRKSAAEIAAFNRY
ncbi:nitroreductase family protein [Desulfogranum mediterraneum]|uniref:nitroreductase family protein n=1 Tax=Desulfogranum mediterraneum TaxID=160661 RepID=UPI0004206D0B|nr:nitroreductase family protein [Desulfogranum mediterraneum]